MALRPLLPAVLFVLVASGCTGLPDSGEKGYVTGDGLVRQIDPADRAQPIELTGEDLDGATVAIEESAGEPRVVVVWGSWCVECRQEQDQVNAAAQELEGTATFVGLDTREASLDTARAYEREFDVQYPSIDANDGKAILAFNGVLSFASVPAFVVLDAEGRVAASIVGRLPSQRTLVTIVEDVAGESGSSAGGTGG